MNLGARGMLVNESASNTRSDAPKSSSSTCAGKSATKAAQARRVRDYSIDQIAARLHRLSGLPRNPASLEG
jgi:hypothetical protein